MERGQENQKRVIPPMTSTVRALNEGAVDSVQCCWKSSKTRTEGSTRFDREVTVTLVRPG